MEKVNQLLTWLIFILTIVLTAAVGLIAYDLYGTDKRLAREEEEWEIAQLFARNQEAQNRIREMEEELQQLAEDKEELQRFIAQLQNEEPMGCDMVSGNFIAAGSGTVTENAVAPENDAVSGNGMVSENMAVLGNDIVPENDMVSENSTVSGDAVVSKNDMVSENGMVSENADDLGNSALSGNGFVQESDYMTLAERRLLRTSLEETWKVNREDRETIAESTIDFSGRKIACLGDSITAAANLDWEENYQQYSYPARLKELLGVEEVYNLGIGGSSIGRYWADAFVDRYQDIPEDVDIIIVMGGTNDGFCVSDKEFGSLSERTYRTFCGDLDELMSGLREHYPDADIFFATPLPNVLHDYLMSERDYLLPQQDFVDVILTLAKEYDFEVIDLYNSNILDSHDPDIIANYIPDGVHANHEGYQLMAEHFAAELIRMRQNG